MTVSIPHLTALLLDLNAEGRRIIRGVVDKGDLGLLNKNDRDAERRNAGAYEYDPGVDAQTEADRRVEAHVLRALGAFCPELRVVAEESYENPEAAIPESDDFADLPGDVAATIAPFRAPPARRPAERGARGRRGVGPAFETTHSTGSFLVTCATRNESPKRLRSLPQRRAFGLASALTGAVDASRVRFRRPAGRHQRVSRRPAGA